MVSVGSPWMWVAFFALITLMVWADLFLLGRGKAHRVSTKEAARWCVLWVTLALSFNVLLWFTLIFTQGFAIATTRAIEFFTGYLIEFSLSVDNLFVFLMIFNTFGVPFELQRRTLIFGILGAIFLRILFILIGVWLVVKFHWILYLFGIFLIYTGAKILFFKDEEPDLAKNPLLIWMGKHLRITEYFEGEKFFVMRNHLLYVTPLFVILILIACCDVMFAVDSIPAIFAITQDPFIILTSNIFAVLGLRAMYFLLASMAEKFHLLKHGVGIILVFVGVKMLIGDWVKIPIALTLGFIVLTLWVCIKLSLRKKK
jgi:tellurite resistance protein TerC